MEKLKKYDEFKSKPTELTNKEMIQFFSLVGSTRKINDWGTDEDTDFTIGISEQGWEKYTTVIQFGAGVSKVISEDTKHLNDNEIIDILNKVSIMKYIKFMSVAYKILFESKYEDYL